MIARSRSLRRNATDAERRLWALLRDRQLFGARFRRQHPVGRYILDFYCPERELVVEVDGGQHYSGEEAARDLARTAYLEGLGLRVLRFTNSEVLQEIDSVVTAIVEVLDSPSP